MSGNDKDSWGKLDKDLQLKDLPAGKEYYERLLQLKKFF